MEYLYADNFRGFTNTSLTIRDINFFVGENSTGKTSMLSLLKLLKSVDFLSSSAQDFNAEDVELGNYRDIVSANATDKSYFRVGLIEKGNNNKFSGFLMTFIERDGIPFLYKYTYRFEDKQTEFIFFENTIKYRQKKLPEVKNRIESISEIFKEWVEEHKRKVERYTGYRQSGRQQFGEIPLPLLTLILFEGPLRSAPPAPTPIVWFAPIRTRPRRTYDEYSLKFSAEGVHTPYLIKKILSFGTSKQVEMNKLRDSIESFGRESGLFKSIGVKEYDPKSKASPFELDIRLNSEEPLNIKNVGYGVSQTLPIIIELLSKPKNSCFALQQPEIHIHPKAQAALGDILYTLALTENKKFIIETHSDFVIDSFRYSYGKRDDEKKPTAQIVFFERKLQGNVLYPIEILHNGELPDKQPESYREFFIKEQMRILGF